MTNYASGHAAESVAAEYLKSHKFEILDANWRTRYCEIDIVAKQKKTVYFVEVKYRKTDMQGGGLDYITPRKLQQMAFAAESWVQANEWRGEYQLAAIELAGEAFQVTNFVQNLHL